MEKGNKFDPLKPFAEKQCFEDFLNVFKDLNFKLYGKINFEIISPDELDFDLYGGEVHYTEQDLKKITAQFADLNKKWGTEITYCLFPSSKKPGIFINVRSPKAKFALAD